MTVGTRRSAFLELLPRSIVIAPMAGGPTTPDLVVAGAQSGALAFLAAGYKSASALMEEVRQVRSRTNETFGVNLFVPGRPTEDPDEVARYLASLANEERRLDTPCGEATWSDDGWFEKVDALLDDPVPIVSFAFGCPSRELVAKFHSVGTLVMITVTSAAEAGIAVGSDVDALCVQGPEAGAHRSTFDNRDHRRHEPDLRSLVLEVKNVVDVPLIGAGGIMTSSELRGLLEVDAVGAQCGTAFLLCPESGADPNYKAALSSARFGTTAVTRAFSGRPARGLVNQFMLDHPHAPAAYPEINAATQPLRASARRLGDVDRMSLWAGIGFKEACAVPAADVVDMLSTS